MPVRCQTEPAAKSFSFRQGECRQHAARRHQQVLTAVEHVGRARRRSHRESQLVVREILRSEEHTSELSHVSISYAVFCLKKEKTTTSRYQNILKTLVTNPVLNLIKLAPAARKLSLQLYSLYPMCSITYLLRVVIMYDAGRS